jgi:HNH endonuclease
MRGIECPAHTHRSPVPLERHHIQPQSRGGKNVKENITTVCGNTHGNVHYLLDRIEDEVERMRKAFSPQLFAQVTPEYAYRTVPLDERETYNDTERRIAKEGWMRYAKEFLRGDFHREYLTLSTSGRPKVD